MAINSTKLFIIIILSSLSLITSSSIIEPSQTSTSTSTSQQFLSPLTFVTNILSDLGFNDLSMASRSLSLSSDSSHLPWLNRPITIFAPADTSLRTCSSCSLPLLLQEHSVPGLYSYDYLRHLIFGTKIETILPGRCLTVTSTENSTRIFIGGAEVTRPNLYVNDNVIVHGVQGFISHLSPYSCSVDKLTSLDLPHPSSTAALTRMMLADAMIRLRYSGYSILSLAMRVKYPDLVTLNNMTIFAVDDVTIFHGGYSYVHSVRYHIIPNQLLKIADLENLPMSTMLPTLDNGEVITVTSSGGGGSHFPMRINYVRIRNPDFLVNSKIVIHGLPSPFPHLHQSVRLPAGRSGSSGGVYPVSTTSSGEYGSEVRDSSSTANTVRQNNAPASKSSMAVQIDHDDDVHQGL